jgi:hypothetical protein
MVADGRVVVLAAGVADVGGGDCMAMAQRFLGGQKQPRARIAVSVLSLIAVVPPKLCRTLLWEGLLAQATELQGGHMSLCDY